jgi:hypothetical protein
MIELIDGLPDGVVGFEAVGVVTADDYARVAQPAVERALESNDRIRLVHVLGDRLDSHTSGAVWKDATLGISHVRSFDRIAVVTDLESIRVLVKTVGRSLPGEIRLFANAERGDAVAWAAEGLKERAWDEG